MRLIPTAALVLIAIASPASAQQVGPSQPSPAEQVQALQFELGQARRDSSELAVALAKTQTALAASQGEFAKLKAAPAAKPDSVAPAKP